MVLTKDLMGVGVTAEEAIRVGDIGPQYLTGLGGSAISTATQIGGPNAATLLEINVTSASVGSVVFSNLTEQDRYYTIVNSSSNAGNVLPPTTAASFNGLGAGVGFSIPGNKVAFISRMGPIPNPTGSISSDRWIYQLST